MELPALVAFDLDNTLAESKQPISSSMAAALAALLRKTRVAVTSGGKIAQLIQQVAEKLPSDDLFPNLFLLPTSGASMWISNGVEQWHAVYEEKLTVEELEEARAAALKGAQLAGVIDFKQPSYGERIELRGSQVTLSALGQQAPIAEKQAWDPGCKKRKALRDAIAPLLPGFDVKIGGSTSIDITKKGVNKAFGIRKISEYLGISIENMLYIGDELVLGGNDEVVKQTGIRTQQVKDPTETEALIRALAAA